MRLWIPASLLLLWCGGGTTPTPRADDIDLVRTRLQAIGRLLPRERFDLHALAASGRTDAELCEFVHSQVGFAPYRGFQRGAAGTLASGCGNAADKALLLATMLRARGTDASLVRGTMPAGTEVPAKAPPPPAGEVDDPRVAALAAAAGVPADRLRGAEAEAAVLGASFKNRVQQRLQRDYCSVLAALGNAVPPPTAPAPASDPGHWWVRTPDGDLDPTLGEVKGSGGEVFGIDPLPADACQTLRFVCKLRVQGAEQDVELLDSTVRTAEVFGDSLSFGVMPVDGTAKVAAIANPTPAAVLAALKDSKLFQPQLATPQRTISGRAFDLTGTIREVTQGRVGAASEVGAGVGGLFGGGISGGDKGKKPPAQLASCFFEIEFSSPGLEPVRVRRDLLRPSSKPSQRVLDLLTVRQVLVAAEGFDEDWLTGRFLDYALAESDQAQRRLGDQPARLADWRQAPRFNAALFSFVAARTKALQWLAAGRQTDSGLLCARPLLVAQLCRFVDGDVPGMESGIDILHNGVVGTGEPASGWADSMPLLAGMLDTVLEHEVRQSGNKAINTSVLLERAALTGAEARLATAADLPPPCAAELTAGTAAFVLVPGQPVSYYRIDRQTGSALGLVAWGGGQDTSEYGATAEMMVQLQEAIGFYRDLMVCITVAVLSPMHGEEQGKEEFANCVWNLVCGKIIDAATSFTEIEPTIWNVLVRKAISETWNSICEKLAQKMGFGAKSK